MLFGSRIATQGGSVLFEERFQHLRATWLASGSKAESDDLQDIKDGRKRYPVFNTDYVYFFCTNRIVLSADDLNDIDKHLAEICPGDSLKIDCADFLLSCLDSRLARSGTRKNIISIGTDCLPRTIATRWGCRPARIEGAKTGPFDLAIHTLETLPEIIETDFAAYLDDLESDTVQNIVVSRSQKIWWNHEVGTRWTANDFSEHRRRYLRRIESFREILQDPDPIVALHCDRPFRDDDIPRLVRIHRALTRMARQPVRLACLCTRGMFADLHHDLIKIFDVPFPYLEYSWAQHLHYVSKEGLAFESAIVAALDSVVADGSGRTGNIHRTGKGRWFRSVFARMTGHPARA